MMIAILISVIVSLAVGGLIGAVMKSRQMTNKTNLLIKQRDAERETVHQKLAEKNSVLERQLSAANNNVRKLTEQLKNKMDNHPKKVIENPQIQSDREYIVFDLECTCWKDNTGKLQETTEIGAVKIKNGRKIAEFHSYVKPVINPQLSEFCTELTKVTQAQVDSAPSFEKAYENFKKWCTASEDYWLLSWGHFDRHKLAEQAEPFSKSEADIEWLRRHTSLKHECVRIFKMPQLGLGRILRKLGLRFEGDRHTALDDARNIASAFLKMTAPTSAIKNDFKFNPQETIKKIKEIHDSEHYGVIVEIGAGLPVSEALFEVSGASKTIHEVLSPYSREAQKELFGESTDRVVSAEHTIKNIQTLIKRYSDNENINFIYLSSFQVGDPGTTKSTHGWVAIARLKTSASGQRLQHIQGNNDMLVWETQIVHMSFHENRGRQFIISEIADNCVPLLYNFLFSADLPDESAVDNLICGSIYVHETRSGTHAKYYKIGQVSLQSAENEIKRVLMHMGTTGHVCVTPDGSMVRMETVFRDKEKMFLYKGSFKPVTLAHVKMAKSAGNDVVMAISIDTYEKGEQSIDSVLWRLRLLNKLGYTVMINRDGYFKSTARLFYNKFGKHVSFLVGSDTFNRIEDTGDFDKDYVLRECEFYIGIRPGAPLKKIFDFSKIHILGDFPDISATEIRKRKTNGDFNGVKEYMPEEVFADYLEIKE